MKEFKRGKFKNKKVQKSTLPKSRKDVRKARRKLKKFMKREHASKKKIFKTESHSPGQFVKASSEVEPAGSSIKSKNKSPPKAKTKSVQFGNIVQEERNEDIREQLKLKKDIETKRRDLLVQANEEEELIIKRLEKQLGMNKMKTKNKTKSFAGDGLDYLLEICDRTSLEQSAAAEKYLAEMEQNSDFDEDVAIATGQDTKTKKRKQIDEHYSANESDSDQLDFKDSTDGSDNSSIEENLNNTDNIEDESDDDFGDNNGLFNESSLSHDAEIESDNSLENEEDNLADIYSRYAGPFPDDEFVPGKLSPIEEEPQSAMTNLKNNIDNKVNLIHSINNDINDESDDGEFDIDEASGEECCSNEECFKHDDVSCDSDGQESLRDTDSTDVENDFIIVKGKTVNTNGMVFPLKNAECDVVKSATLDKCLKELDDYYCRQDSRQVKSEVSNADEIDSPKKRKRNASPEDTKAEKKKKCSTKDKRHKDSKSKLESNENVEHSKIETDYDNDSKSGEESVEHIGADNSDTVERICDEHGVWEDIYGRKRDKDGNVLIDKTSVYVPPHLRKQPENNSQEIIQLKRQMKSVLNKLAGSNMHWACSQLENLYNSNSRNAVNSALCSLWQDAIIQITPSPVRMVAEHAVLIAILQANVGMEVGAHFLQVLVKQFDSMLKESNKLEDKSLDNLVSGLSYLYCFKIFHASLLFEILTRLTENITEKHIECALIALRNVGGVLRKDEPLLLKNFIHDTQARTSLKTEHAAAGTRIQFLMDVLLAIKNNNLNKIPNYDPSYSEELKKAMKGIIRKGNYVTPLNIKMDDLLKADERGKWWVVGSAWNGGAIESIDKKNATKSPFVANASSKKLEHLARQQRMNTDARKNIFYIIMSAEDYMDAFEKLLHLGLKNQQERDIVHVLLACCLQEKKYNPYYAVLAEKFCEYDRKFQLSIQYAVWDKLKELNSFTSSQLVNLAQLLTHLFIEGCLPLSVLKVIHFSELNKPTLRLMRQILLAVMLYGGEDACLAVFRRVAVAAKLHMFRESLRLFIRHFLLKNLASEGKALDADKKALLEERASLVDGVLSSAESKLRF